MTERRPRQWGRRQRRQHRPIGTVVAFTMMVSTTAVMMPTTASAATGSCFDTFNLFIPGTWETSENADPATPVGMLAPISQSIEQRNGERSETYTLPYMARAFDNGHTYGDSKADGLNRASELLSDTVARCPNTRYTVTGYSQGADIAGDLAAAIGNGRGPVPADRVLAVGLLADPGSGTTGEAVVGPRASGKGIADPRPGGMGALSGRVASICDPADLYCSIQKGSNPLLGSLGSILSKTTTASTESAGGTPDKSTQLASALTSDFSGSDLPALGSNVSTLRDSLTSATPADPSTIASTAETVVDTLSPLAELISSGAANSGTTTKLTSAPTGSAERSAASVLGGAASSDLSGAVQNASAIAQAASSGKPLTTDSVIRLAGTADVLTQQIAPLTSTNNDALSQAMPILSALKPSVVVEQALNVATGVTALDIPAIIAALTQLPERVAALDAQGAHRIAGELNNHFAPLVKMAAGVDLRWASQVLSVIPDPSGYTQIAAMVASVLANVDIIKLANIVGQIQEIAWTAVEKLLPPPGAAPDPVGAVAAMTGLVPVGLDLASVAVGMLSGKVSKTSPELLGKTTNSDASSITSAAEKLDLAGLAGSVTQIAQSQGADDLATLVSDGLTAATFFASGTHQSYGSLVVDNAGRNAVQWITDWLNLQIEKAA